MDESAGEVAGGIAEVAGGIAEAVGGAAEDVGAVAAVLPKSNSENIYTWPLEINKHNKS